MDELSSTGFLKLPLELHLEIFCLLETEDIVSIRQTCKRLYNFEQSFYDTIWQKLGEKIALESALFPPTYNWNPFSLKGRELIARRATAMEKILYKHQDSEAASVLTSQSFELLNLPRDSDIHSVFLLPGGRFLLLISDAVLQIWDFSPYLDAHASPTIIKTIDFPGCTTTAAFTVGGCTTSSIRILLRLDIDLDGVDAGSRQKYALSDAEDLVIYALYELSFIQDEPVFSKLGEISLAWELEPAEDVCAFTEDRLGLILESHAVVWNFREGTYATWRMTDPHYGPANDGIILRDHFIIFYPTEIISFAIPSLIRVPPDGVVVRLTSREVPLENARLRTAVPFNRLEEILAPFWPSRSSYGITNSDFALYPFRDSLGRNIHTRWYRLSNHHPFARPRLTPCGSTDHLLPPGHMWIFETGTQRSSNTSIVTVSSWSRMKGEDFGVESLQDEERLIFASILPRQLVPPVSSDSESEAVEVDMPKTHLIPLAIGEDESFGSTAWDFCPLSGLLVVVTAVPYSPRANEVRVYDFVRPHFTLHLGNLNTD